MRAPDFKQTLQTPIESADQAREFLNYLSSQNLLFHPEDNPSKIVNPHAPDEKLFTAEECVYLEYRILECYLEMPAEEDPCRYILSIT